MAFNWHTSKYSQGRQTQCLTTLSICKNILISGAKNCQGATLCLSSTSDKIAKRAIHILRKVGGGESFDFWDSVWQRTGGLFWKCGVTFLDSSIFRTFGLKIANLTQFWNKFGSMSKNHLAILLWCYFGNFTVTVTAKVHKHGCLHEPPKTKIQ